MSDNNYEAVIVAIPEDLDIPVEDAHITLAYLGDKALPDDLFDSFCAVTQEVSQSWSGPVTVQVNMIDYFGENRDACVLTLDQNRRTSPPIRIRELLLNRLPLDCATYVSSVQTFPEYQPHLTLGYLSEGFLINDHINMLPDSLKIRALAVWSTNKRREYALNNPELMHYGILRKSGRYPWGSGEDPYQRSMEFFSQIEMLRNKGLSETEISKMFELSTTELRATNAIAKNQKRRADEAMAARLKDKGMSNIAIGQRMGINESSVRALLDPTLQARADVLTNTANMLKQELESKAYLNIGLGTELHIGIAKTKMDTAIAMLKDEGYEVFHIQVEQVGNPGKYTDVKVLAPPGTTYSDVYKNQHKIEVPGIQTSDGGHNFDIIVPPKSISSDRIAVRYAKDGGSEMDGVLELRPGVADIDLGASRYAQVRVAVDGDRYLKGMAMYAHDLPKGIDIRFNTNKNDTGNKLDAMKKISDDPENPFTAVIRQKYYIDEHGNKQLSVLNIVGSKEGAGEEGGWDWSKSLSSQMLSKQAPELAKRQLDLTYRSKKDDFDEIMSLTNPAVKRKLLGSFADDCDASSVDLKAASLPRQKTHVILPIKDLKDNEVYAPFYKQGEKVVLIRHPHGGTFEIPELVVNNKHPSAKKLLGNAQDAIGINSKVAARLSGADFDGDTVIVIPNKEKLIKTSAPLKSLQGFDPISAYPGYDGMRVLEGKSKQTEMGKVSNLITDMTIKGATPSEIARAVKHSMVVIDAEKHKLNYKQSEVDNGIAQLKEKYQGGKNRGASTLISRAGSEIRVPDRKPRKYTDGGPIDKVTGEKRYTLTGDSYIKSKINAKTGQVSEQVIYRTNKSTKMAETSDAFSLISGTGTPIETIYANHANKLKALANQARLEYIRTPPVQYSPSAAKVYAPQVASLSAKLNQALKNKPLERQAQLLARAEVTSKTKGVQGLDASDKKKINTKALIKARAIAGAQRQTIAITPKEWEAIQSGAISNNKLSRILDHTDDSVVKAYATPRTQKTITPIKLARIKLLASNGYTQSEIASQLGISSSTVNSALNE